MEMLDVLVCMCLCMLDTHVCSAAQLSVIFDKAQIDSDSGLPTGAGIFSGKHDVYSLATLSELYC